MKNNDPLFWPDERVDQDLRGQMRKNYDDCINILQTQWYQADLDQRFVMGDQDIWGILYPNMNASRRKMFNFNITNGAIQMVSGYQRQNRKSSIAIPVQSPIQKTADQLTKCLYHVHNQAGAYQVYSDAFEMGALTKGLGFVSIYKDTTTDIVSGDIKTRYIDMCSCLFDPYFRKHDMSDCRYFWTRQFFDREEAANLYSEFRDEILALPRGTYKDDKFYFMPEVYQIQFPNLIALDEYWYLSTREATFLVDMETEECREFEGDEEDLRDVLRQFKGKIRAVKKQRPTVRRTLLVNDRVLVDEPNPYGLDVYPFVPFLGYFNPDTPYYAYKFRGIVRDMRDPQYLFNRLKVTTLDILESQQQGLKIKKGALVTADDALNSGNGRILAIDPAFQMTDVEPMQIIPPSPVILQMEEMLKSLTLDIAGATEAMMGSAVDDKAGILEMLRQGAGLVRLQKLFDQCDESQRLCSSIIVQMIQKNWSYGKVKQVIGEEPTAEFDSKLFFKYGVKVTLGVLTETQQQLQLQQLLHFREVTGIDVPSSEIIKASTLQNKDELVAAIEQKEEAAAKMAEEQHQAAMEAAKVDAMTKMSYANSQDGLAEERRAKIDSDKAVNVEKIAKSQEERAGAVLDLIKAMKELDGMNLDHLHKKIVMMKALQEEVKSEGQQETAELAVQK